MAEAMLGELAPGSRVLFPADYNSAAARIAGVYRTRGEIWTLVVAEAAHVADLFTADEARALARATARSRSPGPGIGATRRDSC